MDMSYVHTEMREVAISIDEARQREPMLEGGMNYEFAMIAVRTCRRAMDERPERATVLDYLSTLVNALCMFRGSVGAIDFAIERVERLIQELEPQAA